MISSPAPPASSAARPAPNLDAAPTPATPSPSDRRLLMTPAQRVLVTAVGGFVAGGFLGLTHGGLMARLRFRAENAHRLPTTTRGWYFYHKTKNYHVLLAGIKAGFRTGGRVGFWTGSFGALVSAVERLRGGNADFVSPTVAGATSGVLFGLFNRLSWRAALKITRIGTTGGLVYGLGQDALMLLDGRRLGYVDYVLEKLWVTDEQAAID